MLKLYFSLIFLYPSLEHFDDTLITACDVDDGVFLSCPFFSHEMSWMRFELD